MPVLVRVPSEETLGATRKARDRVAATMIALAPMTRIASIDVQPGVTGMISRCGIGPLHLIRTRGFTYTQYATTRTTDGIPEGLSMAVRPTGTWALSQAGVTRGSAAGDRLTVVDVTRAMYADMSADTQLFQMFFSADQLGLTVDEIRAAAAVIERSPLRSLVASHVLHLPDGDGRALPAEAAQGLGAATIGLVRAMLIAATRPEDRVDGDMRVADLVDCVKRYVHQHIRDPALNPAKIARAHHVSLRHLYNAWSAEPTTISRWIIQQRLAGARESLVDPRWANRSIATIAQEWGFANPTHFTRRFHEEYGVAPREWRRMGAAARSPLQSSG